MKQYEFAYEGKVRIQVAKSTNLPSSNLKQIKTVLHFDCLKIAKNLVAFQNLNSSILNETFRFIKPETWNFEFQQPLKQFNENGPTFGFVSELQFKCKDEMTLSVSLCDYWLVSVFSFLMKATLSNESNTHTQKKNKQTHERNHEWCLQSINLQWLHKRSAKTFEVQKKSTEYGNLETENLVIALKGKLYKCLACGYANFFVLIQPNITVFRLC